MLYLELNRSLTSTILYLIIFGAEKIFSIKFFVLKPKIFLIRFLHLPASLIVLSATSLLFTQNTEVFYFMDIQFDSS